MKTWILSSLFGLSLVTTLTEVNAAMLGLCNDPAYTQYICCPANGGWIVSSDCNSGASLNCQADTGLIAGTNTTILQDCHNRGGYSVMYPMLNKKP